MRRIFYFLVNIIFLVFSPIGIASTIDEEVSVPILTYHRFGPTVRDGMTVTTPTFAAQLQWLKDHNYKVIPLKTLVDYLLGKGPAPAPKSVVITADDGHKSVYTDMLPLIRKYNIPVTLFIYPSAISNASYALTWKQLQELHKTGLFDIQGHTYWHPNFKQEKKRLSADEYQKLVHVQLYKSKAVLEKKLDLKIDLLAWPFGIYNSELEKAAKDAGYVAAFSIDARNADKSENMMTQPRYLMINAHGIKGFASIMTSSMRAKRSNSGL